MSLRFVCLLKEQVSLELIDLEENTFSYQNNSSSTIRLWPLDLFLPPENHLRLWSSYISSPFRFFFWVVCFRPFILAMVQKWNKPKHQGSLIQIINCIFSNCEEQKSVSDILQVYLLRLSRPASMYVVSSGLVDRGLRLWIPDVPPSTVETATSEDACHSCRRNVRNS